MPFVELPGEVVVKSRDQVKADYLRSYGLRNPDAKTGPGTAPDLDAGVFADQSVVLYANAKKIGNAATLKNQSGEDLDDFVERRGIKRAVETGSSGFVTVSASSGGGTIQAGDRLHEANRDLFWVAIPTAHKTDGQSIAIGPVDTGPATNLDAGTVLQWETPRPGIGPNVVVVEQLDGTGLSGGRNIETDESLKARFTEAADNPAAAGNDGELQHLAQKTPGTQVEKAFTYPAILGPGTTGLAFTMRPASPGASRIPNSAQMAEVLGYVKGQLPADYNIFMLVLVAQAADIVLDVEWAAGVSSWVDETPWPPRYAPAAAPGAVVVLSVTDSTNFILDTDDADYTGVAQPSAGQTIGFYDSPNAVFRRKRILTVTGTGPWTIVVDTSNDASDTGYVPIAGQRASPWSESLDSLVPPVLQFFDRIGPGEQVASFFDPGSRQKRSPVSPKSWPSVVNNRILSGRRKNDATDDERGLLDLDEIQDTEIVEGLGQTTTVGTAGVQSYLLELQHISAFPQ